MKDPICGMDVNENTPLKLTHDHQTFYFCSQHCLKRFSHQHHINYERGSFAVSQGPWYQNKVVAAAGVLILLSALSYTIPILVPFRESLWMYGRSVWWAVLIGLFLGGVVDYYIPREYISQVLARHKKRTIFYSVGLGFLMSVCSHGILAISMELYKKGASTPAVIAFLLASPWANITITILLISFFGVVKTLYIMASAITIAVTTGFIYQFLERHNWVEKNPRTLALGDGYSIQKDFQKRFKAYRWNKEQLSKDIKGIYDGSLSLVDMVLLWILIGVGLASLSGAYVPKHIFHDYMGPTVTGLLITLGVATILEVCSEGMAPLAFEIYRQTGALGNSLVFLMAGVATDYTEIGLVWQNIGHKAAIWLPIITVPQIILWGIIANNIFK